MGVGHLSIGVGSNCDQPPEEMCCFLAGKETPTNPRMKGHDFPTHPHRQDQDIPNQSNQVGTFFLVCVHVCLCLRVFLCCFVAGEACFLLVVSIGNQLETARVCVCMFEESQ